MTSEGNRGHLPIRFLHSTLWGKSLTSQDPETQTVMEVPLQILGSRLAVLTFFTSRICLTFFQPPFKLGIQGVLLNSEQTKLRLTCGFDL